ncbi:MAG: toprim domain-containing protein, partial [Candidatus Omnitrophica bacterium]|nr:toprim domain-containing protein [Candidatus Omnitrophota bacterium]
TCLDEASLFFHKALLEDASAKPVIAYLNKRGITLETIKKFRIGYSLGRNSLIEYMRRKNFTLEALEKSSLAISQGEAYRDLFRERVMFPIFDIRSRTIGFGARTWRENDNAPKYINSIESQVYSKRDHLFGFNFSKDDIAKADCAIVVEGYLDMIMPYVSGIKNIVASLGTALTVEQIRLIRRYTNNVTLVYDSDKAGQMATLRALDLMLENDLKVKVVSLPQGFDPDSLVRAKPREESERIFADKKDFFDYKVAILSKMHDVESIEGKTKIAQEIFSTLNKLNSEIEKYEYIKKLSFILRVKEEILIAEFKKIFPKKEVKIERPASLKPQEPFSIAEKTILKFMFSNKKAFPLIRKNLREEDFSYPLARKTVSYFLKNYSDSADMTCNKILGAIEDKEISGFISKILLEEDIPLENEAFKGSILKLRQKRARHSLDKLREDIKEAEIKGEKDRLKVLINKFDKLNCEVKNA